MLLSSTLGMLQFTCTVNELQYFLIFFFLNGIFLHFMVFKANIQLISLFVQYVCGKENCHINV